MVYEADTHQQSGVVVEDVVGGTQGSPIDTKTDNLVAKKQSIGSEGLTFEL